MHARSLYAPHMLFGSQDPAHPNNLAHTIHNVLAGRVRPFPPGTSSGCMALVGSLLQTQPSQRQTLKGLMADAWLKQQVRIGTGMHGDTPRNAWVGHLMGLPRHRALVFERSRRKAVGCSHAVDDVIAAHSKADRLISYDSGSESCHHCNVQPLQPEAAAQHSPHITGNDHQVTQGVQGEPGALGFRTEQLHGVLR